MFQETIETVGNPQLGALFLTYTDSLNLYPGYKGLLYLVILASYSAFSILGLGILAVCRTADHDFSKIMDVSVSYRPIYAVLLILAN